MRKAEILLGHALSSSALAHRKFFPLARSKIIAAILIGIAVGGGGWYYRFIYSYERWFDTHLLATIWTPTKEREVAEILRQPFHYCGQGSTSKAYVSADGKFVLKTFLKREFRSKTGQSVPGFRELANRRKELRIKYNRIFGPINAYQYIPKESGMIYYQFMRPNSRFNRAVELVESDGSITSLDLNRDEYVVQKKAVIVADYLRNHLAQGDTERVKNGIAKLLQMAKTLYDQGIVLVVLQFLDNFGFVDDEPIRIDVEHLRFDPKWKQEGKTHFKKEAARFRDWIQIHAPQIIPFFDETLQQLNLDEV